MPHCKQFLHHKPLKSIKTVSTNALNLSWSLLHHNVRTETILHKQVKPQRKRFIACYGGKMTVVQCLIPQSWKYRQRDASNRPHDGFGGIELALLLIHNSIRLQRTVFRSAAPLLLIVSRIQPAALQTLARAFCHQKSTSRSQLQAASARRYFTSEHGRRSRDTSFFGW